MIEWDVRAGAGVRAAVLELGQSHCFALCAADRADALLGGLETDRPSFREAREPAAWCRRLEALAAGGPALVLAETFGTLAGARLGDAQALLFTADAFTNLAAPDAPSAPDAAGGLGPVAFEGTLVIAARPVAALGATRIASCVAHTSVAEAAETLAGLAERGGSPAGAIAVAVARRR